MFSEIPVGTKVRVARDLEDLESNPPWVGAIGIVTQHNASERCVTINVTSGNVYPEDGDQAWFSPNELEVLELPPNNDQLLTMSVVLFGCFCTGPCEHPQANLDSETYILVLGEWKRLGLSLQLDA